MCMWVWVPVCMCVHLCDIAYAHAGTEIEFQFQFSQAKPSTREGLMALTLPMRPKEVNHFTTICADT